MSAIKLSINTNIHNKDVPSQPDWINFKNIDWTPEQVTAHITHGGAICVSALKIPWRKRENFLSSQIMGVDFDKGDYDLDQLAADEFIHTYGFLIYRTASYTTEQPRARALFILDQPITDGTRYMTLARRLCAKYPTADMLKDEVRIFFGADCADGGYRAVHTRRLPIAVLEALPVHTKEADIQPREIAVPTVLNGNLSSYTQAAVQRELDALVTTTSHRNDALVSAAYSIGGLVAASWSGLSRFDAETLLYNAALANGYVGKDGESAARATIQSGLNAGMTQPRALPAPLTPRVSGTAANVRVEAQIKADEIIKNDTQLIERYEDRLQGKLLTDGEPLIIPFKALHKFGGFAEIIKPGKLIGVAAATGGGKTMFIESWLDAWRRMGYHALVWSPEWLADEQIDRLAQRAGAPGLAQIYHHETWLAYQARGAANNPGVRLSSDQVKAGMDAAMQIDAWRGRLYTIDKARLSLNQLLDVIEQHVTSLSNDARPRVLVVDYAQMLKVSARDENARTLNDAVSLIKDLCIDLKLVGLIASQVTKSDSRLSKNGEADLGAESMQWLRMDEFNLGLSLKMLYEDEKFTGEGEIKIVKNSLGESGKIRVPVNVTRGAWIDVLLDESTDNTYKERELMAL